MLKKLLLLVLVVVLGGYAAAEVWAKGFAETKLEEAVAEKDPQAQQVEASVSVPLIFGLLTRGRVERVEVAATHVAAGSILADRASAVLHGVALDVGASVSRRKLVLRSIDLLDVVVEISQEEASKLLPAGYSFEFGPGSVALRGPGGIEIGGDAVVEPPAAVRFQPDPGVSLPRGVTVPAIELAGVSFVACVREVVFTPGVMQVTCSQENPPPRFPPEAS